MTGDDRVQMARAISAIDEFVDGHGSLENIQSVLESCRSLLAGDGSSISAEMFNAVERLEEIRFARLESEQFPEAVFLLDSLRGQLENELPAEES